jgi:hypothetical protein
MGPVISFAIKIFAARLSGSLLAKLSNAVLAGAATFLQRAWLKLSAV